MRKIPESKFNIDRERSKAEKMTTVYTGMPHGSGDNHSPVEEGVIKLERLENAYREVISELSDMREELSPLIDKITDDIKDAATIRAVMRLRYLDGYDAETIAGAIRYTSRQVYYYLKSGETVINERFQ